MAGLSAGQATKLAVLAYIVLVSSACYLLILRRLQVAPPQAFGGFRILLGGTSLLAVAWFWLLRARL